MTQLLLDTHAWIWLAAPPDRGTLSRRDPEVSSDGRVRYANERFRAMVGLTAVELGKKSIGELVAGDDRERTQAALDQVALEGASVTVETALVHASGNLRKVEIDASRLNERAEAGIVLAIVRAM